MATPAVTGAAALYKASRPKATPAEVREALQYLGNLNWKTSTDPDSYHERLLDVSKLGPLGTFSLSAPTVGVVPETGGAASVGITINRSSTFFERVKLYGVRRPRRMDRAPRPHERVRLVGQVGAAQRDGPDRRSPAGTYEFTITGTNQGRSASVVAEVTVGRDLPTALAPTSVRVKTNVALNATLRAHRHHLARGQRPVELDRRLRVPVEPRRRRMDGHGRHVGLGPDRGPQPRPSTAPTSSACGRATRPATGARGPPRACPTASRTRAIAAPPFTTAARGTARRRPRRRPTR